MIQLSPQWFVFLYLLLFLSCILALWVGFEAYWRWERKKDRERVRQCRNCGARFDVERLSSAPASQLTPATSSPLPCPACGALQDWMPSVRRT